MSRAAATALLSGRSRADPFQVLLHVRQHRRGQYRTGRRSVDDTDRHRPDHRLSVFSRKRPNGLQGPPLRRRPALVRQPDERSSADPHARCKSGAGARAAGQRAGRPGGQRDHRPGSGGGARGFRGGPRGRATYSGRRYAGRSRPDDAGRGLRRNASCHGRIGHRTRACRKLRQGGQDRTRSRPAHNGCAQGTCGDPCRVVLDSHARTDRHGAQCRNADPRAGRRGARGRARHVRQRGRMGDRHGGRHCRP